MEITKGKWEIRNSIPQSSGQGDITVYTDQIIAVGINAELDLDFKAVSFCGRRGNKQAENHAKLIADAGNTYQETNKLPSELAEANKKLLEACNKSFTLCDKLKMPTESELNELKLILIKAIKKASE